MASQPRIDGGATTRVHSLRSDPDSLRVAPIVWTAQADGHTEYLSNLGSEWVALPVGAGCVWGWLRLVHPDDTARMRDAWVRAVLREAPFEIEGRLRRPDGSYRWMEVHGVPRRGVDGRVQTWIGTCTDVDVQDQLLERLRDAERNAAESLVFLEALQSTAPVGFGFVDRNFVYLRVNETLASINGMTVEEHIGRRVPDVVPDLWPQVEPLYRQVIKTGEAVVNTEIASTTSIVAGQTRYWLMSYYPVSLDGEIIGIGVVVVEVTERRAAANLQSVVMANMAEGVYAVDGDGSLTFMNEAASRMLGWEEDELRGKPMHAAIHSEHADGSPHPREHCQLLKAQIHGLVVRVKDDSYTRKDGSKIPVAYSAAPLVSGTSDEGIVVVFRDTTLDKTQHANAQRELEALTWIGRIRDALEEDRFVLYSQPILPLAGGEPTEELLLRMVGRDGEVIAPGSFLPVAERFELIGEIDEWVVKRALRIARNGRRIAVNLSASSIDTRDLLPVIERELHRTRVNPAHVVFEITETTLMSDIDAGEAFAHGVAELGCGLALDDFGTGFGSFTYLKKLPITYLKIDMEFVRELASNVANQHVVRAVVSLAQGFGAETIAEGVEDEETMTLLSAYGVDYAQGFHLGRPGPAALE